MLWFGFFLHAGLSYLSLWFLNRDLFHTGAFLSQFIAPLGCIPELFLCFWRSFEIARCQGQ